MTRKVTSYRLPEMTLNQIEQLAKTTGSSDANVIAFAIDRMYQQEIKTMTEQFQPFDSNTRYSGNGHSPAMGQPGHGNTVKHVNDDEIGRVIQSNTERSLVHFGSSRDWYPNTDLKIHIRHIATE